MGVGNLIAMRKAPSHISFDQVSEPWWARDIYDSVQRKPAKAFKWDLLHLVHNKADTGFNLTVKPKHYLWKEKEKKKKIDNR
jgi:hypothetical protein